MSTERSIFVFGSNLAGIHGAGAARDARLQYGAVQGQGIGMTGNAYAIPTKDRALQTLPIGMVQYYVQGFLFHAENSPHTFLVTRVGCGLAGFRDEDIAPLFLGLPMNCQVSSHWSRWFPSHTVWTRR